MKNLKDFQNFRMLTSSYTFLFNISNEFYWLHKHATNQVKRSYFLETSTHFILHILVFQDVVML